MEATNPIIYLVAFGLTLIIAILIARAVFSIPTIVNLLKTQNILLTEIAKANGVKLDNDTKSFDQPTISDEELEKEALSYPKE